MGGRGHAFPSFSPKDRVLSYWGYVKEDFFFHIDSEVFGFSYCLYLRL